jgi:hypothetical protein
LKRRVPGASREPMATSTVSAGGGTCSSSIGIDRSASNEAIFAARRKHAMPRRALPRCSSWISVTPDASPRSPPPRRRAIDLLPTTITSEVQMTVRQESRMIFPG